MEEKKPTQKLKAILVQVGVMALLILAGYGAGALMGRMVDKNDASAQNLGVVQALLMALVIIYLVLLTHELGHLLAGKLAGMRPFLLITGPLKITATQRGLQVGLNTNLALAGGLAACMPASTDNLRKNLLVMTAGGPAASLLGAILGLSVFGLNQDSTFWSFVSLVFGATSLGICIVTLFPTTTSGFMTDGAQILSLLRGGAEVEQRALLVILQAESMKGVRPRDYSPELIERLRAIRGMPLLEASTALLIYYHHFDRGDMEAARNAIESALALEKQLPEGLKQAFYLEYAFFQAAHLSDAATARQFLQKSSGALAEKHTILRSEAAVLFAEGQPATAREKALKAIQLAHRAFDAGGAAAEAEWVQRYTH